MRLFLILTVVLISGCISRTQTLVPSFSGQVLDLKTGAPLSGVTIVEIDRSSKEIAELEFLATITDKTGVFNFAAITSGTVYQIPTAGAGWPVRRTLEFSKPSYRNLNCEVTNISLFGKENYAHIAMSPIFNDSPQSMNAPFLTVNDNIRCQAFNGSYVIFEGLPYEIVHMEAKKEIGAYLFDLRSLDSIPIIQENIPDFQLQLLYSTVHKSK